MWIDKRRRTDNDGLFLDDNVYGHVGDIAIFNPCDKRTAAGPVPLPFPPPFPYPPEPEPEPSEPGIYIDKECYPGIFGGEIHCLITVTNIGETPSDPIDIWDAATILSGPGAGGGVIIAGVTPDGPDWICSPTPTPDLWCSLPPDALLPGETRSIDVWIDTGPLFGAGGFGFRNCASLEAPWFDVACDEGGTDITVTKTTPAACLPGGDCTFTVTITNSGTFPFSGDVLLTDSMFLPDGTALGAPITAIAPPFVCAPPPGAIGFSCVAPLALAPGDSLTFAITVTMPAPFPAYWAQNCFAVSAPGLPPPALPLAPGVPPGAAASCAWVPVGAPPPLSNLRTEKTALHGGECYKLPGDVIACDYEIEIFNDGPSPFLGPVSFTDAIPATATLTAFPAPWVCLGGPPVACGTVGAVALPVGGSITVPVTITTPLAPLEAAGCGMPNTAALTVPAGGTDQNYFAGDDTDTATADAFLFWLLPDGTTIVTCDPTNLKTTKVSKGDCVASGGGYRCDYVVTVTNMGPDPFKGPIKISEQFGFAPSSVQFSPAWGHTGGGANHQLTLPDADLEKGENVELSVTATVPDGTQCRLKNTAVMTAPAANTRFNKEAGDDAASATATIPSKGCVKPDRPQCEPGTNEFRSESGACVCKSGYIRDEKGHCVGVVEAPRCPDGKPVPKSGRCPEAPPQCEPGQNEQRNEQGQCVCKSGYERDKSGRCVEPPSPADDCKEKGWTWTGRRCVEPSNPADDCKKKGWNWDGSHCVPPPNPADECKKKGWIWTGKRCVEPPSPADECRKKGWVWDGKRCLPPTNPADECEEKGWVWDGERCLPPSNPADECRKKGWVWDGKRCLSPADACRKKGWVWSDKAKSCLPPTNPADECRKKGWVWNDKAKSCLPPSNPADECRKKGWLWDDKRDRCMPPSDPADECRKKGWVWDGKRCLSPADACKTKGWVWNDRAKSCLPPPNPADECRKKGWVWSDKAKSCLPPPNPADECRKKGWVWNDRAKSCLPPTNPADECKKKGGVWDGKRCLSLADACKAKGWVWDGTRCRPPTTSVPR